MLNTHAHTHTHMYIHTSYTYKLGITDTLKYLDYKK